MMIKDISRVPIESTFLFIKAGKSEVWANLYLALLHFFEKGLVQVTTKQLIEQMKFCTTQQQICNQLTILNGMKIIERKTFQGTTGRYYYLLNEVLFVEKEKIKKMCENALKESRKKQKVEQ